MSRSPFVRSPDVWLFRNIITNQIILSPEKVLSNRRSMAQLPPNRRLHPTALRKDHWVPLLKASFSSPEIKRQVYSRLQDYQKWRSEQPVPTEQLAMRTKARQRLQIDQVATSIADLAQSCHTFASDAVKISWLNQDDKNYASSWPENVSHHGDLSLIRGWSVVEDSAARVNETI